MRRDCFACTWDAWQAMSEAVGCDELTTLLRAPLRIEAVEGETPWPPGDDDPETLVYDVTSGFMESLTHETAPPC